ncbi:MAG: hypothetical protein K6G64_04915 [Eubacterium sp.]|nr:hypothetical protein [Eubacterium sp.]
MKFEKLAIPMLVVVVLIFLFPTLKKEWDKYNNPNEGYAYVPETINTEEYEKKGYYYPGTADYDKNEYTSKYLGIRFALPKDFVMEPKTIRAQKLDDFNKYKDPKLYSDDIVFEELQELVVTSNGGDATMQLIVGRGSIPLDKDTSKRLADHLKQNLQNDAGSTKYTVKKIHKEKIGGQKYNVIDIVGKNKGLDSTFNVQYYIRNVKKNYIGIIVEGTSKKDMKKMVSSIKKL